MLFELSSDMQQDIEVTVHLRAAESRVIPVFAVAEEVQLRFTGENAALEDIAVAVARIATRSGCALELEGDGPLANI